MLTGRLTRLLLGSGCFLGLASLGVGLASPPAAQSSEVTKGRDAFGQACIQCHGPGHAAMQTKSPEQWKDTVFSMIARGAPVLPEEIEPLTAYLSTTFGPGSPSAGGGTSPDSAGADGGSARALLEERCALCHSLEQVTQARKTEAEWKETLVQMLAFGAQLSADEQRIIQEYAVRNFGPE